MRNLGEAIKTYASSIGVDCLGITSAAPFVTDEAELRTRIENGTYSAFAHADIILRCNPAMILPGCKSMIVVALAYPERQRSSKAAPDVGHVAHYARFADYHDVLHTKLEQLAEFLTQQVEYPHAYRISVDSGPCLEKAAAKRAGIGWIGKNSLIFTTSHGSWVALGVLLTNVPLVPDQPQPSPDCGDCDLCMRACPTGAIVAPYVVDPKRCLSYVTQMPGQIPLELRKPLGRRIWGCDTCQTVCPWNKAVTAKSHPEFGAMADLPELLELLSISKQEFNRRFGPTAMRWRGKGTLQRNAAIALGNLGSEAAVPKLSELLAHDPKPVLRGACAWALGQIGGQAAEQALQASLATETDDTVRNEIMQALAVARGQLMETP